MLNYEFPPAGGGAGFATYNIARELVCKGVDVDILTSRIDDEADGETVNGARVYRVTSWRKGIHDCGFVGAYSYVAFAVKKRWELHKAANYDLEHFFFSLPTGALTLAPLPGKRPPYIVSLRGSDVPGYDSFNKSLSAMHKILLPINRRIWRKASSVVALSNGLREIALRTDPDIEMEVVSNGMNIDKFRPRPMRNHRSDNEPLKILTVTRLLERKGVHHLLEAIARPTELNVELRIVGSGSYEQELRRVTEELGLMDRVTFEGFVSPDKLPDLYREADLFVLPSQTESFGLVFAEAMACALPVVATHVGGIPELIRSGKEGILVEPNNPSHIRAALEDLLSDASRLIEMGNAGRRRIEEQYTWDRIAQRYLEIYQRSL
jgi:glycosyltransferase involved in cell wall biosynthesis